MSGYTSPGPRCQVRDWFDASHRRGDVGTDPPRSSGSLAGTSRGTHPGRGTSRPWTRRLEERRPVRCALDRAVARPEVSSACQCTRSVQAAAHRGRSRGLRHPEVAVPHLDYRSPKKQAVLARAARERYGDAKKAAVFVAQGRSEHVTGRAMDLYLGISNSGRNARARAFDTLPVYQWLKSYLPQVGLNPYPYSSAEYPGEPWHVSFNVTPF